MLGPELLVVLIRLRPERRRPRDRHERHPIPFKILQPRPSLRLAFVDAVDLHSMTRTRDVQPPIPRATHKCRLRVERVVPATAAQLEPSLGVDGQVDVPGTPGKLVPGVRC